MVSPMTSPASMEEYYAIAYYRLSKVDRNKTQESDSIVNQRKLIQAYLDNHPNITLVDEAYDDGYTGTNYNRPGFQKVLDAIESGRVNCVIVKDLSRLGREYISTGKYIETVFPDLGVRFIAINDDVDSNKNNAGDDLLIPIKNIMNESYCRELSRKLRNQFRIQRGNGEFLGAFASYGYCKSPDDKHKLVVDEYAAEVVKGIFSLKIKGYSPAAIATFLNAEAVLPPSEYKRSLGLNYKSGFISTSSPQWSAMTVKRILTNPVYMGTLVQGKRGTPNYKVKRMKVRKEDEWVVINGNHPAIIDPLVFSAVQNMLKRDTRATTETDAVYPLSGMLFCADCGRTMSKRTALKKGVRYYYYVCSTYKNGDECSSHSISCEKLDQIVLNAIQNQIAVIAEMEKLLAEMEANSVTNAHIQRLDSAINKKQAEIEHYRDIRMNLYESYQDGVLDRDEFEQMRTKYSDLIAENEQLIQQLTASKMEAVNSEKAQTDWIGQYIQFQGLKELTREAVFSLIDRIYVYADKRIRIEFNYRNEIEFYTEILRRRKQEVS